MWAYSRHGAYTVKTGYKMIVRAKASSMGPVSQEDQVRNALKKRIWKILTLPNIRMFLWRAVSSALAVAERLKSGGLGVDITCKLCQGGTETINHVFFQCPTATRTWSDVGIALPIASLQCSLEDNLSFAFDIMEDKSRPQTLVRTVPWVLWLIWKNINSIMYAETQIYQEKLLRDMIEEVEQWFMLNNAAPRDTVERPCLQNCDRWLPPEEGLIKCNIHANWRSTALHSGIAWIARDQAGNVSHHARDAITHAPNRMVAEIRYVIWSLTSLSDIGVTKVIIASDYNEVVEAIKAPLQWPRYRDLLQ